MAHQEQLQVLTATAGADLSASQFLFVAMAADGKVDPAGDGVAAMGVLQNNPDAEDKAAAVGYAGKTMVKAGATIAAGDLLASDADGKAVPATTGEYILGIAVEAIANADEIGAMLVATMGIAP